MEWTIFGARRNEVDRLPSSEPLSTSSIFGLGPGSFKRASSSGVRRIVIPVCGLRTPSRGEPSCPSASASPAPWLQLDRGLSSIAGALGPKEHPAGATAG